MSKIVRQCKFCNKDFLVEKREVNRGHGIFCSSRCFGQEHSRLSKLALPKPSNAVCAYCNKSFYRKPSHFSQSKSSLHFCCRIHKDLAQKFNGVLFPYQPKYKDGQGSYRKRALENLPNKCNRCSYNKYTAVLIVHHIDRNRSNNSTSNLEILCPNCHAEEHFLAKDGLYNHCK